MEGAVTAMRPRRPGQFAASQASHGSPWLPVLCGFVAAELTAYLFCRVPTAHNFAWSRLLLRAAGYVTITGCAGAIGVILPYMLLRNRPALSPSILIRVVGPGWLFFPCIALLYRQFSPWILPAVAAVSVVVALGIERLAATGSRPFRRSATAPWASLYGLPGPEFNPWHVFLMAVFAEGSFILAAKGAPLLAGMALSACLFLAVWRWRALHRPRPRRPAGLRSTLQLAASATLATFFTLILWWSNLGKPSSPQSGMFHRAPPPATGGSTPKKSDTDYVGIILLPPPVKKHEIVPPAPRSPSVSLAGMAKPVIIPFDGPYWYLKAPQIRPAASAHVAHGKPTEVNVRSSDAYPLVMKAHQDLGASISLDCCSGIDLAITNADARPGRVAIGMLLSDSTAPHPEYLSLGERRVLSSEPDDIPPQRPPVNEVLHFAIPPHSPLHHFNEVTIVFVLPPRRSHSGAKLAIDHFVLVPR
jgi:hypothetical protein